MLSVYSFIYLFIDGLRLVLCYNSKVEFFNCVLFWVFLIIINFFVCLYKSDLDTLLTFWFYFTGIIRGLWFIIIFFLISSKIRRFG